MNIKTNLLKGDKQKYDMNVIIIVKNTFSTMDKDILI